MKISLLEPIGISQEKLHQLSAPLMQQGHTFLAYDKKTTDVNELKQRSSDSDIIIIANTPYPNEVVFSAKQLKMLCVAFTGIDHVGLDACKERGITVCNAAGYSTQTVAELAIGLTVGLLRSLPAADQATRNGLGSTGLTGREIAGRTVGIIGTGQIGLRTAQLFQAFGAKVIAYSRSQRKEAIDLGISYVTLEELLQQSDIVSLHVPSNPQTKGLIGSKELSMMKSDALLINCARGPIVDNTALAAALNEGRLGGAGIDVFDQEPPLPSDYPLLHAKNTLLTPHIAFASEESMIRRAEIVFQNIESYLNGTPNNVCAL